MSHRRAITHLRRVDPKLAAVIDRVGRCTFAPQDGDEGTHFAAVARSIVYQQLSGKAAATIYGRFTALFDTGVPSAAPLLEIPDETLRSVGLSRQKTAYLKDLAARVHAEELAIERLHELDDDEIIAMLTSIKGIGRWTAQMFLMFRLGRPDVLPELDLGIQNAIKRAYRKRKRPAPKDVKKIGARWSPYSSIASWYLWRSLENGDGQLGAE